MLNGSDPTKSSNTSVEETPDGHQQENQLPGAQADGGIGSHCPGCEHGAAQPHVEEAAEEEEEEALPPRPPQLELRVDGLDFYALLGVGREASLEDIRRGYREQALIWHPDKNTAPEATRRFQAVTVAHETLTSAKLRQEYDILCPPLRPTAAEIHPHGFDVPQFRARPSDLQALASFPCEGKLRCPVAVCDVVWWHPEKQPQNVRVSFFSGYAWGEEVQPSTRQSVHKDLTIHLATLLHSDPDGTDEPPTLVLRQCVLGAADTASMFGRMRGPQVDAVRIIVRFAVEGVPLQLASLFQRAHAKIQREASSCIVT